MGGHGGLNILPQKSWNGGLRLLYLLPCVMCSQCTITARAVYGRENRLKVSRDEAKFEEENKLKRERHVQVTGCPVSPVSSALLCLRRCFEAFCFTLKNHTTPCRLKEKQGGLHCCKGRDSGRQECCGCSIP